MLSDCIVAVLRSLCDRCRTMRLRRSGGQPAGCRLNIMKKLSSSVPVHIAIRTSRIMVSSGQKITRYIEYSSTDFKKDLIHPFWYTRWNETVIYATNSRISSHVTRPEYPNNCIHAMNRNSIMSRAECRWSPCTKWVM